MLSQLGSVSGFVHAAGVLRVNGIGQLVDADLDLMWRIHVSALAHIANVLMPYMVEQKNGRVVLIGSRVAQGLAGRSHYAASKAALIAMAKSWASEVVAQGVTVNVVSPAATQTAMLDDPARQTASPKVPPLGRLIQPQEIASLVGYLLSPMAAAITGQDIQICGGSSLPR
jgi:NAD(P)-dependent dehydrogenase (short-subunit alcohol dehydrogenase family)